MSEAQSFNFNLRSFTKICHLLLRNYSHFMQSNSIFRQMMQIKGIILVVQLAFGSSLTAAINANFKELSMQVKEAIIRSKSRIWYILKQEEFPCEFNIIKMLGRPWKTYKVDNGGILFFVKKTPSHPRDKSRILWRK